MQRAQTNTLRFAFLLILAGLGAACSQQEERQIATPPPGVVGEVRLSLLTEPITVDPALTKVTSDVSIDHQLFRGLFWYDEKLNLVPMVASQMPTIKNKGISDDGLVYTIKLRDDFRWSDGQAVTAADFEYSIKRLLDPATRDSRPIDPKTGAPAPITAAHTSDYSDIRGAEKFSSCGTCDAVELAALRADVGVKAVDARTMVFTLRSPNSSFLYLLSQVAASPVRKEVIDGYGDKWTDPNNLITNGPFVLKEWTHGERLVLEPNPYWQATKVQLKRVTIKIIPNSVDAFNAYLAGDLDVASVPNNTTVEGDPVLKKQNVLSPLLQSYALFMNETMAPFDNKVVRQAFSLAVDRVALVNATQAGGAQVAYSWLPPGMPGYDKELGLQWKFDPARARSLLAQAGYPGGVGLPSITYPYAKTLQIQKDWAQFLQKQLQENLGVFIDLEPMDITEWRIDFAAQNLQLVLTGYQADYPNGQNMLQTSWTCQKYEGDKCMSLAGSNHSHYANPRFDSLMQQAAKETDAKRRLSLYSQAEKLLVEDVPAVFVSSRVRNQLVKPYVAGAVNTGMDILPFELFLDRVYTKS